MAKNPFYSASPPLVPAALRSALARRLVSYLQAPTVAALKSALLAAGVPAAVVNAVVALDTIPDVVLRALDPALLDDAVWAVLKQDLGL